VIAYLLTDHAVGGHFVSTHLHLNIDGRSNVFVMLRWAYNPRLLQIQSRPCVEKKRSLALPAFKP
jgi:hypothetical protein